MSSPRDIELAAHFDCFSGRNYGTAARVRSALDSGRVRPRLPAEVIAALPSELPDGLFDERELPQQTPPRVADDAPTMVTAMPEWFERVAEQEATTPQSLPISDTGDIPFLDDHEVHCLEEPESKGCNSDGSIDVEPVAQGKSKPNPLDRVDGLDVTLPNLLVEEAQDSYYESISTHWRVRNEVRPALAAAGPPSAHTSGRTARPSPLVLVPVSLVVMAMITLSVLAHQGNSNRTAPPRPVVPSVVTSPANMSPRVVNRASESPAATRVAPALTAPAWLTKSLTTDRLTLSAGDDESDSYADEPSPHVVRKALRALRDDARECAKDTGSVAHTWLNFEIAPSGHVKDIDLEDGDRLFKDCVERTLLARSFPVSREGRPVQLRLAFSR